MTRLFCIMLLSLLVASGARAHSIEYQVENRGISVRFFYSADIPVNYSQFEVFGPGDTIPHQKGRTDRNGFASFLPDRPGKWSIKVVGESDHGAHAAHVDIDVKESLLMESFSKPLVAAYPRFFVGVGLFLGVFGLWALWASRRSLPSHKQDTH